MTDLVGDWIYLLGHCIEMAYRRSRHRRMSRKAGRSARRMSRKAGRASLKMKRGRMSRRVKRGGNIPMHWCVAGQCHTYTIPNVAAAQQQAQARDGHTPEEHHRWD